MNTPTYCQPLVAPAAATGNNILESSQKNTSNFHASEFTEAKIIFSFFKIPNMKKTTKMLFLVPLVCVATATKAQTIAQMQDTVATYAPHLPLVHRWTGEGKVWWGLNNAQYTHATQDSVVEWMDTYPTEATDYFLKVGNYFATHPVDGLLPDDRLVYEDIHAIWLMIHAND
jgi:hypothetical protein